jgi:hypothetical protein
MTEYHIEVTDASWQISGFYEVNETAKRVTIVAVGHKEHNILFVQGKEVQTV